jgi:hypothetical protein
VRSFLSSSIIAAATVFLTGCGPVYQTQYSFQAPRGHRARNCIASNCERNKLLCERNCAANDRSCEWRASDEAQTAYHEYAVQQREHNQPISKSIDDFKSDWGCNQSCGCDSVYRQCYSTCGGTVIASTVCVAFCNQKNH